MDQQLLNTSMNSERVNSGDETTEHHSHDPIPRSIEFDALGHHVSTDACSKDADASCRGSSPIPTVLSCAPVHVSAFRARKATPQPPLPAAMPLHCTATELSRVIGARGAEMGRAPRWEDRRWRRRGRAGCPCPAGGCRRRARAVAATGVSVRVMDVLLLPILGAVRFGRLLLLVAAGRFFPVHALSRNLLIQMLFLQNRYLDATLCAYEEKIPESDTHRIELWKALSWHQLRCTIARLQTNCWSTALLKTVVRMVRRDTATIRFLAPYPVLASHFPHSSLFTGRTASCVGNPVFPSARVCSRRETRLVMHDMVIGS